MSTMKIKLLLILVLCNISLIAIAQDTWPPEAKSAYISRCSASMNSQGLPVEVATEYCTCAANGMEAEFGMKEYNQMMQAQPNPNGDENDRRLYSVMAACQNRLRK